MLKIVHRPTGSACAKVRRVSAGFCHFALFTSVPQRKRELAASGCCLAYSIRRTSVMMSITARSGTSYECYQNGNRAFQQFFSGVHRWTCGGREGPASPTSNASEISPFQNAVRTFFHAPDSDQLQCCLIILSCILSSQTEPKKLPLAETAESLSTGSMRIPK